MPKPGGTKVFWCCKLRVATVYRYWYYLPSSSSRENEVLLIFELYLGCFILLFLRTFHGNVVDFL